MSNIPREPSDEPGSGGMKNRGAILLSIALVAMVLLVAECNKSKDTGLTPTVDRDGFSIVVNRDGTFSFEGDPVPLPAPKTEELKPILQLIRNVVERPTDDYPKGETVTAVIIISKGSLIGRGCGLEDGEWVCRRRKFTFED